ncbi:hypothetical protein L6Q96_07005 [Candidatus Binatia bacterium]|nr:hypothetical protein [Candidatus Binatia bacterium]
MRVSPPPAPSLVALARCSVAEIEALYAAPRAVTVPSACYRGVFLAWLDAPDPAAPVTHFLQWLGFRVLPFGVDFIRSRWFFFHPALGAGRFTAAPGRSRWRDTETIRLEYAVSRLPGPLRRVLYDEVKPLSSSLCLGIGGTNAPRGRGDHFFFALVAEGSEGEACRSPAATVRGAAGGLTVRDRPFISDGSPGRRQRT